MRGSVNFAVMAALSIFACVGPPIAAAAPCNLSKLAELPVTMTQFRPLVSARINGAEARLFIDTGSFWMMLTPAGAAKFGLHVQHGLEAESVVGVTGESEVGSTHAAEFDLDKLRFHDVPMYVAEHGLELADGLVGQNLMGAADAEYDLANGVVRLFDSNNNCIHNNLAYWAASGREMMSIDPFVKPGNQIRGEATLNGVKIRVLFDTGTPRSMITLNAARRAGVRMDGENVEALGVSGGVGNRLVEEWLVPFDSFAIGDEQVHSTRLRVANVDLGDDDMLLGADFFLSHRLFIAKSQNRIYFTYNGGPVFDFEHGATPGAARPAPSRNAQADDTPRDAPGFVLRADAFLNRQEFDKAIADYTSAIALQPDDPAFYTDRGAAYALDKQPKLALSDFDQALKLHPDAPRALLSRGELRLSSGDAAGARTDFDAAIRLSPAAATEVGDFYAHGGFYEDAVAAFSKVLDGKPVTEDLAQAFFERCQARTYWGKQLDQAVADCNQAMKLMPGALEYWEFRGADYLRLGNLDAAIADFDSILRRAPHDAFSLYARGVAETRKGVKDKGAADMAAATALDQKVLAVATKLGIGP
jgi:tetratricopeptide (TPR) repeat protein